MSFFKTSIPVDVESVKKLFPEEYTIEKIAYDPVTSEVVIFWHARYVTTKFSYPVDFPIDLLKARGIPEGSVFSERRKPVTVVEVSDKVDESKTVDKRRSKRDKKV